MKFSIGRHVTETVGLLVLVLLAGALIAAQADRHAVEALRSAAFETAGKPAIGVDGVPRVDAVAITHPLSVD